MELASGIVDDPIQLASALKAFAELRQSNAISDADYDGLKARVLAALERRLMPEPATAPESARLPQSLPGIEDYAGDLHRLIAEKLAREYPSEDEPSEEHKKRYLLEVAALLVDKNGGLRPSDMPHMAKLIGTAVDQSYAKSLQQMVRGLMVLDSIRDDVRLSADSSPLAKTITGIASDSAKTAVDAETAASTTPAPNDAQRRNRFWGTVEKDVTGAFVGAGTAGTILAVPGFPIISLAVLAALGPAAAVVPALAAVVGGATMSGIERARTKGGP